MPLKKGWSFPLVPSHPVSFCMQLTSAVPLTARSSFEKEELWVTTTKPKHMARDSCWFQWSSNVGHNQSHFILPSLTFWSKWQYFLSQLHSPSPKKEFIAKKVMYLIIPTLRCEYLLPFCMGWLPHICLADNQETFNSGLLHSVLISSLQSIVAWVNVQYLLKSWMSFSSVLLYLPVDRKLYFLPVDLCYIFYIHRCRGNKSSIKVVSL